MSRILFICVFHLLVLVAFPGQGIGKIVNTESFLNIADSIRALDFPHNELLVLFDVNDVIAVDTDEAFHHQCKKVSNQFIQEIVEKSF